MNRPWLNKLRKVDPYIPGEQSKNKNLIKLNANENPYPPSPLVAEAIKNIDTDKLRFYPDANSNELKEALSNFYGVDKNQIFLGNGSDDVLALSFMSFFNSDKPLLFPDITYSFYKVWCDLLEIDYKTIPLDESFRINPKDYMGEKGGVIIPNPNAPTGIGEGKDFIKELMNYSKDVIVIIDEAYVDFGGYSSVELLKEYENLLIVHTYSKSRSLAGMRIGVAIGNPILISTLESVKNSYNSYTIDSIALAAGTASVKDIDYFNNTMQKIIKTREYTIKELENLGFSVCPSKANFVFATHSQINAKELFQSLKNDNIFIRYFDLPRINNYLRITIGTDNEMKTLIECIKKYI